MKRMKRSTIKRSAIEQFVKDFVGRVDYDHAKNLDEDCAEGGPEAAREWLEELSDFVEKWLEKNA